MFNVQELAKHIADRNLIKFRKLLDESVDEMTRWRIPEEDVKLVPANKGEMVASYHV